MFPLGSLPPIRWVAPFDPLGRSPEAPRPSPDLLGRFPPPKTSSLRPAGTSFRPAGKLLPDAGMLHLTIAKLDAHASTSSLL